MNSPGQPPESSGSSAPAAVPPLSPLQVFWRFLQFGLMAWGGPVAQIGMVRRELVEREHWVSNARFNQLLAIFQVLPGPEAHELCVYFGTLPAGRLGGLLAGLGFMLPGFVLMFALSWLYFRTDLTQSALTPAFLGMQVAVIALIVRAVHRIGQHVLVTQSFWVIAIAAAITAAFMPALWPAFASGSGTTREPTLAALAFSGLKTGLLTFGGAYTAIPFLRHDAVGNGWMTNAQFLDGLALSGILPAPLIIFSTFVGYVAGGPLGAIVMTAGVFLPAFSFGLFLHDHLERVLEHGRLRTLLDAAAAAVVGLIAATTIELARAVVTRLPSVAPGIAIFAAALVLLYLWNIRTNVVFVVLGAAVAGWALF